MSIVVCEAFCSRFEQSQKLKQDLLMDLNLQNRGKRVTSDYSNQTPNASPSVAQTNVPQYGMPPNYFAGQSPAPGTVRPTVAKPVRPVPRCLDRSDRSVRPVQWWLALRHSHNFAPLPSSAASGREDELADFVPPYTTKSYSEPPLPPPMP